MNSPVRLLLLWFLLFGYFFDGGDSALSAAERAALLLLRASLAVRRPQWPPRGDPCTSWTGVNCSSNRVELLDLTSLRPKRRSRPSLAPGALPALTRLAVLNASGFPLPGPIPAAIGNVTSLSVLSLAGTGASGDIPPALGRLARLAILDLSGNSLSGQIPRTLWALPQLVHLDVSSNNLTGVLPTDPVAGNRRAKGLVFNLSNNLFYGTISAEFNEVLQRFRVVDLSGNYFEGNEFVGLKNASFASNCFSSAGNQRSAADCEKFYAERGLSFYAERGLSSSEASSGRSWRWWYNLVVIGCGLLFLAVVAAVFVRCLTRRAAQSADGKETGANPAPSAEATPPSSSPSLLPSLPAPAVIVHVPAIGDAFTYDQLLKATSGFGSTNLIKNGHSGDLYHGVLEDGTEVVVKRVDLQVVRREAFLAELNLFESVSDGRLIPFLGRCLEHDSEKLLVYKYMSNGDLASTLHKKPQQEGDGLRSLDWITRLKIATGIAEALCFLHHESNPPLVHRDIEAGSILLDDKYEVRLGSLSEICTQQFDVHQNVLTRILRSSQASARAASGSPTATCAYDIYCLGKVLLELVTGKLGISGSNNAATNKWLEDTQQCISLYDKELVSKIVDPSLMVDEDHMEEVWAMAVIARSCLDPRPAKRPLARHVVKALENPLKVVRDANYSTSTSRGSWYNALVGSWWHNSSSIISATSKHSVTLRSHPSGEEQSSSQKKMSREIFPEPAGSVGEI